MYRFALFVSHVLFESCAKFIGENVLQTIKAIIYGVSMVTCRRSTNSLCMGRGNSGRESKYTNLLHVSGKAAHPLNYIYFP